MTSRICGVDETSLCENVLPSTIDKTKDDLASIDKAISQPSQFKTVRMEAR